MQSSNPDSNCVMIKEEEKKLAHITRSLKIWDKTRASAGGQGPLVDPSLTYVLTEVKRRMTISLTVSHSSVIFYLHRGRQLKRAAIFHISMLNCSDAKFVAQIFP